MEAGTRASPLDLEALVEAHQADVWRWLRYLGAEPPEADDLAQETFLAVLRRPFEERSRDQTAAYLRRVARNQLLNARRRRHAALPLGPEEEAEAAWERFTPYGDSELRISALRECIEDLPDRARRAVQLRYRKHSSGHALAEALHTTDDGARSLLKRARQLLRECIEKKERS